MNKPKSHIDRRYHLDKSYIHEPRTYGCISLYQIGRLHCTEHTVIHTHTHLNWFELTLVTDGCGFAGVNGEEVPVQAGDIHLSFPGDFHSLRPDADDPMKYNFLAFYTDDPFLLNRLEEITRQHYPSSERIISDERIAYLTGNAIAEVSSPTEFSDRLIESILIQIALYLISDFENNAETAARNVGHPEELCYQMMHYIDTHLYNMDTLANLAEHMNYSYSYLSDLFHRETGDTLHTYYRNRRLTAAQLLIREGKLTLSEIASLLQYSSIYTFSRAFHEQFGLSPSAYRKSIHA